MRYGRRGSQPAGEGGESTGRGGGGESTGTQGIITDFSESKVRYTIFSVRQKKRALLIFLVALVAE